MKRILLLPIAILLLFTSCDNKKDDPTPDHTGQTVLLYLPWSGDLTSYFVNNIADFGKAIAGNILKNERVLVFFSSSATEATLFELKYDKGECVREIMKEYTDPAFTTAPVITSILNDVKAKAPADRYAMIIGCHGMGWIPVGATRAAATADAAEKEYWEYDDGPKTRWFGGTSAAYQTDITTLSKAVADAGIKMEYIMFDDCYMSSIEVAYELKDVTDHLIASPNEIMAHGMPYDMMAQYLVGKVDYAGIARSFHEFYRSYSTPCGTIAVTVSSELDKLASVMKEINDAYDFDGSLLGMVQRMDGYTPVRFFDYGDYVASLCGDEQLLSAFTAQLERAVPSSYKSHTEFFYTRARGKIRIDTFTGSTISDPSTSSATAAKEETAWYKATH